MIRKTAAITAASIAGVIVAGGAAVGANIGILNAADDSPLGDLSAEAPITSPTDESTASLQPVVYGSDAADSTQRFAVDVAGTVDVESDDAGVHLSDVRTSHGWSWQETSTASDALTITFTSDTDMLEFVVTSNGDGTISASVDRPISAPSVAPSSNNPFPAYDDQDDYEEDEEHDYEEDEEHEGRDHDD